MNSFQMKENMMKTIFAIAIVCLTSVVFALFNVTVVKAWFPEPTPVGNGICFYLNANGQEVQYPCPTATAMPENQRWVVQGCVDIPASNWGQKAACYQAAGICPPPESIPQWAGIVVNGHECPGPNPWPTPVAPPTPTKHAPVYYKCTQAGCGPCALLQDKTGCFNIYQ